MPATHAGERPRNNTTGSRDPDNTTKEHIMNTTVGSRRARLVRNAIAGLALVATVGTLAACGDESSDAPTQSPSARAVAAAQGSDRHLELKAAEVFRAEQRQAAQGSDRHLELRAGEIFRSVERRQAVGVYKIPNVERRQAVGVYTIPNVEQAAYGSDRHLELRAGELKTGQVTRVVARRQQVTYGSDRHLDQLAKDIAARAQWARRGSG
jgi:hypothetical protein